jgi:hypothetical protein
VREAIDACEWLYLREIGEPKDNTLRLVVEEAKADGPPEDVEILPGRIMSGTRAIESDATCRAFELVWRTDVSYSVRNESFVAPDDGEVWEGRLFCRYSRSHFLEYVARATFAGADYPGPLQHWGVNCLNHIVDVVSADEPQVREIEFTEPAA